MSDDLIERIRSVESEQQYLRMNQEAITRDLKETSDSLRQMSSEMNVLVNNVSNLTTAVTTLAKVTDKTQQMEISMVEMRTRTESVKKLWEKFDSLKERMDSQSTVIKAVTFVSGSVVIAIIGMLFATLGG